MSESTDFSAEDYDRGTNLVPLNDAVASISSDSLHFSGSFVVPETDGLVRRSGLSLWKKFLIWLCPRQYKEDFLNEEQNLIIGIALTEAKKEDDTVVVQLT